MEQPLLSESRGNLTTKSLEEIFSSGLNEMVGDYHAKNDQLNEALQQLVASLNTYNAAKEEDPETADLSPILTSMYQFAINSTIFLQAVASDMDTTVELFRGLRHILIKKFLDFDDSLMDMDDRMDTFSDVVYELKERLDRDEPDPFSDEFPISEEDEEEMVEVEDTTSTENEPESEEEAHPEEPDYHDPMDEPDEEQEDPDDDPSDEPDDDSYAYEEEEDDEDEDWTQELSLQRRYPDPVSSPERAQEKERHMSRDRLNELQDLEWELLRVQQAQEQSRKLKEDLERDREIERDLDRGWSRDR